MSGRPATPFALFHPAFQTFGGAEILVATQAQYLKRAGLDVSVVTLALDPQRSLEWLRGIPVRVAAPPPWFERLSSDVVRLKRSVVRADACLSGFGTVMACNFPTNALLGASAAAARRVWCCTEPSRKWHLRETNPRLHARVTSAPGGSSAAERSYAKKLARYEQARKSPNGAALILFDLENTRRIESLLAISEFARDCVRRVYGRNEVRVLYPMVRFPPAPAGRRPGLDRTGLRILTQSRLEIPKNMDTVLHGFSLFAAKHREARLHVVGEGPERGNLEQLARRLGVSGSVHFHGYLSDGPLQAVYDACDVFALLPLDEPFGMVFPEAAARGLLLVGPDHGGPFEIVDGGRLGWAQDPFSPEALAATFEEIWASSDGELDSRRERAEKACRDRYSEATIGPELRRALEAP